MWTWWVEIYKNWNTISSRVKEKLWLALNFNEALAKVESEVKNWKVDTKNFWTFRAHFEWMSYDESTQEISSFWEKTKIDKRHKQIAWLDGVQFASWEELFHAVNIVNFAKKELKWKWATNKPFIKNDTTWDIDFTILGNWKRGFISANWSDFWTKVLWASWAGAWWLLGWYALWLKWWLVWTVWGGLWWYALWSIIDNTSAMWRACGTIAKWANLDRFILYLNNLNIWKWEQEVAELDKVSPIYPYFNEVKEEFKAERVQDYQRNLSFEYDDNNPSEVLIQSYGQLV